MKILQLRPSLLALALALAGLTGLTAPAQALSIKFRDTSAGGMSAAQLAAFQAAGDYWQSQFTDNVTVFLDIAFDNLGSNVLGSTSTVYNPASYASLRTRLTIDARTLTDTSAIANLQAGPALTFFATQGDLSSRFDNDGSINNTRLGLTTANAKALGLSTSTNSPSNPDATIKFANAFAGDFVYTRVGGTPSNKIDFITVAEHEIGHALGFTSGVDDIDSCVLANFAACGLSNTVNRFETDWWYEPLDLFRYSAAGVLDMRVGGSPYFSVDGGATSIETFSTGVSHGNGSQASHFGTGVINLMRPSVSPGQAYDATARDLAAFDAIGWDLAAAVPEPRGYAMLLAGLGVIVLTAHRRRR